MSANGSKADFMSAFPKAVVSRRGKNPLSKASLFYHLAGNRRAAAVRDVITSVPPFARDALADRAAIT